MNNEKKISLSAVVINCICAIVWNVNLLVDLVYGYSNNISFYGSSGVIVDENHPQSQ